MRYLEFHVSGAESGARLREYLAQRLSVSGRRAKALLDARNVFVNGRRVWMAGHGLASGDTVAVLEEAAEAPGDDTLRVIHTDPDFLVVDKPPGIASTGPDGLEEALRNQRGEAALMAAHRLDRDTSGCLLVARNPAAFDAAIVLFREHRIHKEYRAIVAGRLHVADRTIDAPVEGQSAVTRIRTISAATPASYLAVQTLTGRTHQIRVHLAGIQHPVLGDRQYGPQRGLSPAHMQIPRQMLHASKLSFRHPGTKREVVVQAGLPPDFRLCLKRFKLRE